MWRQKIDSSDRRIMNMFGRVWASAFMRHGLEHMQSLVGFVCLALASGFWYYYIYIHTWLYEYTAKFAWASRKRLAQW
ncbi:unnamed protein product [Alternaria burnsii]|nr:unnamed protein product [Alternaria burnsii]